MWGIQGRTLTCLGPLFKRMIRDEIVLKSNYVGHSGPFIGGPLL